jgi:hypothetical protein
MEKNLLKESNRSKYLQIHPRHDLIYAQTPRKTLITPSSFNLKVNSKKIPAKSIANIAPARRARKVLPSANHLVTSLPHDSLKSSPSLVQTFLFLIARKVCLNIKPRQSLKVAYQQLKISEISPAKILSFARRDAKKHPAHLLFGSPARNDISFNSRH